MLGITASKSRCRSHECRIPCKVHPDARADRAAGSSCRMHLRAACGILRRAVSHGHAEAMIHAFPPRPEGRRAPPQRLCPREGRIDRHACGVHGIGDYGHRSDDGHAGLEADGTRALGPPIHSRRLKDSLLKPPPLAAFGVAAASVTATPNTTIRRRDRSHRPQPRHKAKITRVTV
jgi:hypothetical protein